MQTGSEWPPQNLWRTKIELIGNGSGKERSGLRLQMGTQGNEENG